jgi:non-structural maintenance of chromosomes element 4
LEDIPDKVRKKLKKNPDVCGVELLFNPKSFTQTVENIFHYSFLVKQGVAGLTIKNERKITDGVTIPAGPSVVYHKADGVAPSVLPKQAIVSLTMKDWRDMIQAYGVQRSDVPHRTGSKFQHDTSATGLAKHNYEQSDEDLEDEENDD